MDQASEILSHEFYRNVIDVLTPQEPWQARFDIVASGGGVTIGDLSFGVDVRIRFGELGAYHVDVPLSGRLAWRQGGGDTSDTASGTAAVFQPVGDTVLERWGTDCRLLAVKIDRAVLESELAQMLDAPIGTPVHLSTFDVRRGVGAQWTHLVRLIATDAALGDGLTHHPAVRRRLRESLVSGLLLAAGHRYRDRLDDPQVKLAAPRTVRRVTEAIHAEPGTAFTLGDLAVIAGVGRRSLQDSFQRHLGLSPMTYLRDVRLTHAHRELLAADPGAVNVAEIAYRWGFAHLGRFAASYRDRYGVSPSMTLRG